MTQLARRSFAVFLFAVLLAAAGRAAPQCPGDDASEPNDTCNAATAWNLGGSNPQQVGLGSNPDYFVVFVPNNQVILVDQYYSSGAVAFSLELYEGLPCSTPIDDAALSQWGQGVNTVAMRNSSGATQAYYVRSELLTGGCQFYDLEIYVGRPACRPFGVDDGLEQNDACGSSVPLSAGVHTGLYVTGSDPDFYSYQLPPDTFVLIEADFGPGPEVTLELHPDQDCFNWLSVDMSAGGPISVGYMNTSTLTEALEFSISSQGISYDPFACVEYELEVTIVGPPAGTTSVCFGDGTAAGGTVNCPCGNASAVGAKRGCLNSTGSGAKMVPYGSASFVADDLFFVAFDVRASQPGVLVQGNALTPQPFRDGLLCVSGSTERVERLTSAASGTAVTTLSIVQAGSVPGPGATRYYQYWFRDPQISVCGTGSNLSNAIRVDWN